MRRGLIVVFIVGVTSLFLVLGWQRNAPPGPVLVNEAPNVILVIVDALRADRLVERRGARPLMPNLDRFAEASCAFHDATAQASWTKPSMVSILTALYPATHRIEFGVAAQLFEGQDMTVDMLPGQYESAAMYFKRYGYATACIQSNRHLAADFGFAQGFDVYHLMDDAPANRITDAAVNAIENIREPFFLYVHYLDPHAPYDPPPECRNALGEPPAITESDRALLETYDGYYLDKALAELGLRDAPAATGFSPAGKEYVRWLYDGEVRFVDDHLGRLLAHIERMYADAVVVVTADHGEELWDHGSVGHSKTVYQELVHVPLIMRLPALGSRAVDTPVETIDILPTIASYFGLPPNPDWQGRSIAPRVASAAADRPVFAETRGSLTAAGLQLEAVRVNEKKLIVDRNKQTFALFDLKKDPLERVNRAQHEPETVEHLTKLLDEHRRACSTHPLYRIEPAHTVLDAETIERLRTLGYLAER